MPPGSGRVLEELTILAMLGSQSTNLLVAQATSRIDTEVCEYLLGGLCESTVHNVRSLCRVVVDGVVAMMYGGVYKVDGAIPGGTGQFRYRYRYYRTRLGSLLLPPSSKSASKEVMNALSRTMRPETGSSSVVK